MNIYKQLPLAIAFGLCASHAFADTTAGDAKITFTGSISAQTCKISDQTVTLPTAAVGNLTTAGNTSGQTAFQIKVSGCAPGADDAKNVGVEFSSDGTNFDNATGTLKNQGKAANVNIQVLNKDYSPIAFDDPTKVQYAAINGDGNATLPFYARYYATGAAGPGDVNTYASVTLTYQ
ncbi:fimbrial protein [Burkholderia ubonensis]|uniref:fimbrial protein n=1 Tax=Burkholderia ubonensis TaxID=101571 RepID=UPI0008FE67BF|nr:fimbrial protein [Burkholderia ubonensis]OJA84455.1 hypothetical protein BGV49_22095 [Burkholderia ubonensis]